MNNVPKWSDTLLKSCSKSFVYHKNFLRIILREINQLRFICSESTTETLEKGVKKVPSKR